MVIPPAGDPPAVTLIQSGKHLTIDIVECRSCIEFGAAVGERYYAHHA